MKLVVTGGRNFEDKDFVFNVLDNFHNYRNVEVLFHGCAKGIDYFAGEWAKERNIKARKFWAYWDNLKAPKAIIKFNKFGKKYNSRAGIDRNQRMVEKKPDILFWFSREVEEREI